MHRQLDLAIVILIDMCTRLQQLSPRHGDGDIVPYLLKVYRKQLSKVWGLVLHAQEHGNAWTQQAVHKNADFQVFPNWIMNV